MFGCCGGGIFVGIVLIDLGWFDGVVGDGLYGICKLFYFVVIFSVGWCDMEC